MILISKSISCEINTIERDDQGRFLLLDCKVNDVQYILINLYAPTSDKKIDQRDFGNYIYTKIKDHVGKNVIIGGDLNIRLDEGLRFSTRNTDLSYGELLLQMMNSHDLVDIWRLKHPDTKRYTWREKTRFGFAQSRIDYFLISCHLEFYVTPINILPSLKSDHSLLTLSLASSKYDIRGRGLWKFNCSLLDDDSYVTLVKSTIKESLKDSSNLENKFLKWDYIKCRIRTESITYSIKRNRKRKQYLDTLNKRLLILENTICTVPSPDALDEYESVKKQIEDINDEIARGHMIRSRCKFIEEHEKPSKYFLNLEKATQNLKHIHSLRLGGNLISDPVKILEEQKAYFARLYSENNHINLTECENYLSTIGDLIPKISGESQRVCDGILSINEIKNSVDALANNKAPGPDGLPAEFYKFFWDDIGHLVAETFFDAFDNGVLSGTQKQGVINLIPKKDKDLTELSSWRPLSILNTDYKIIAKVLATRLKTCLGEIIDPDQIGYMEKRFCGENTRLIADIIDYCNINIHA